MRKTLVGGSGFRGAGTFGRGFAGEKAAREAGSEAKWGGTEGG